MNLVLFLKAIRASKANLNYLLISFTAGEFNLVNVHLLSFAFAQPLDTIINNHIWHVWYIYLRHKTRMLNMFQVHYGSTANSMLCIGCICWAFGRISVRYAELYCPFYKSTLLFLVLRGFVWWYLYLNYRFLYILIYPNFQFDVIVIIFHKCDVK